MNKLLTLTTIIEAGAGLAPGKFPFGNGGSVARIGLDTPVAVAVGRLAGVALCALGLACWLAHYEALSCAARGVVTAMTLYNFGAVVILGIAGTQLRPVGVVLWPAVVLHAAMTVWCVTCLLSKPAQTTDKINRDGA